MTVDTASLRASGKLWGDNYGYLTGHQIVAIADALDEEQERVRVLTEALQWYADERNYDEIGRPGVYVPGSTAGGFVQDPDWDTDDGWRAERALEAALATAGGEGATP